MKRLSSILVAVALGGCFATVGEDGRTGGGQATFTLNLPEVLPPLVVVQPGVSVVRDLDQEVFYANGYYWVRQDGYWYRAPDHRRGWTRVEPRGVPAPLVQAPPGRYRHYRGEEARRGDREQGRRDERDRDGN
jgi:hypothetical protein